MASGTVGEPAEGITGHRAVVDEANPRCRFDAVGVDRVSRRPLDGRRRGAAVRRRQRRPGRESELPEKVDTDEHAGLLRDFGVDPAELADDLPHDPNVG